MPISRSEGLCAECLNGPVMLARFGFRSQWSDGGIGVCPECLAEALQVATGLKFQAIYRYNMAASEAAAANRAALLASGKPLTKTMRQNIAKKSL